MFSVVRIHKKIIAMIILFMTVVTIASAVIVPACTTVHAANYGSWVPSDSGTYGTINMSESDEEGAEEQPDPSQSRAIEAKIGEMLAFMASTLNSQIKTAGFDITTIILGRVKTGVTVNDFSFELQPGNSYGYLGAKIYNVLRGIVYVLLAAFFILMTAKQAFSVSAKQKSEYKDLILTIFLCFSALALFPQLIDLMLYVRDIVLKIVVKTLYDTSSGISITGAYYNAYKLNPNMLTAMIYLSAVMLTLYFGFSYVSTAITQSVVFLLLPIATLMGVRDKKLIGNTVKQFFGNALIPILDIVVLAIPLNIEGAGIVKLVGCCCVIPARGIIRQVLGFGGGNASEMMGFGAFAMAMRGFSGMIRPIAPQPSPIDAPQPVHPIQPTQPVINPIDEHEAPLTGIVDTPIDKHWDPKHGVSDDLNDKFPGLGGGAESPSYGGNTDISGGDSSGGKGSNTGKNTSAPAERPDDWEFDASKYRETDEHKKQVGLINKYNDNEDGQLMNNLDAKTDDSILGGAHRFINKYAGQMPDNDDPGAIKIDDTNKNDLGSGIIAEQQVLDETNSDIKNLDKEYKETQGYYDRKIADIEKKKDSVGLNSTSREDRIAHLKEEKKEALADIRERRSARQEQAKQLEQSISANKAKLKGLEQAPAASVLNEKDGARKLKSQVSDQALGVKLPDKVSFEAKKNKFQKDFSKSYKKQIDSVINKPAFDATKAASSVSVNDLVDSTISDKPTFDAKKYMPQDVFAKQYMKNAKLSVLRETYGTKSYDAAVTGARIDAYQKLSPIERVVVKDKIDKEYTKRLNNQ